MNEDDTCPDCHGSGDVKAMTNWLGPDDYEVEVTCPTCKGTGSTSEAIDRGAA